MKIVNDRLAFKKFIKDVAQKVVERRKAKGITQVQFAELMGCKQSTIARIESGKTNPTLRTLWNINRVLDMEWDYPFPLRQGSTPPPEPYIYASTSLPDMS